MNKLISLKMLPQNIKKVYFVGIGGIGMSAIAIILKDLDFRVQGSDISENDSVKVLKERGIEVFIGQKGKNISEDISVIVRSTAIKEDNPELLEARRLNIPVIHRSEMLKEIMQSKINRVSVTGSHGKTTTTGIMQSVFQAQDIDSTVVNGGIINLYNLNAYLGKSDWIIAEADESDGSFLKLPATIGVITSLDKEHLEHYGSFENLKKSFIQFMYNIPFYGFLVVCKDYDVIKEIISDVKDRKIITYGIKEVDVDLRAVDIRISGFGSLYDIIFNGEKVIKDIFIPYPGIHNIYNSLATVSVGLQLGFPIEKIKAGLKDFSGIQRRFTKVGVVDKVTVIDDYAHHPEEIKVTVDSLKQLITNQDSNIIAVFQPHRYTRLKSLFNEFSKCFESADIVIVTPVYSAGEQKIKDVGEEEIAEAIRKQGKDKVYVADSFEALKQKISSVKKENDFILCLGAGNITSWAKKLVAEL